MPQHGLAGAMPDSFDLLSRCRNADARAWHELFEAHFEFVHRVARRLGTPEDELEDVCQDVFAIVHRKLDDFREGRFTTWLYRIAANVVSDRHRRRRFRRAVQAVLHLQSPAPDETAAPDAQLERRDAERAVARVVERMSPKRREVFVLFELEGLSGDAIAEHVGCKVATVWTHLFYARKEFERIAQKLGLGDDEGERA